MENATPLHKLKNKISVDREVNSNNEMTISGILLEKIHTMSKKIQQKHQNSIQYNERK